jgi:hypothetical protein
VHKEFGFQRGSAKVEGIWGGGSLTVEFNLGGVVMAVVAVVAEGIVVELGTRVKSGGRPRAGFGGLLLPCEACTVGISSMTVVLPDPGVSFIVILDDLVRAKLTELSEFFGVAKVPLLGVGVFIPWDVVL